MQYSYGIDASSSSHLVCKKKRLLQRLKKRRTSIEGLIPPHTSTRRFHPSCRWAATLGGNHSVSLYGVVFLWYTKCITPQNWIIAKMV